MKKIINRSVYSTDTATKLGDHWSGHPNNDFNYLLEALYRTKAGKYFLYGQGGPMTCYAEFHGNSRGFGEKIIPLTLDEAKNWAEENLDGDDYEKIFGPIEEVEGEEKLQLTIAISQQLKRKLLRRKDETGMSITSIIEELIRNMP